MNAPSSERSKYLTLIIGSPREALALCRNGRELQSLAMASLALLVVGCGAFGFLLGWPRSPLQAVYAALKLPVAWLITLAVCTPAYYALAAAVGAQLRFRTLCAAVLMATGRASAVLLGLLPVLWLALCLASDDAADYHRFIAVAIVLYVGSGLAALGVMARLLRGQGLLLAVAAGLFLLVGGQSAWTLRPFVGRPADDAVPFLRPAEDTFLHILPRALRSATGDYDRVAPHSTRSSGSLP